MEMYELVLGKTHFSDFGCQEKIHCFNFGNFTQSKLNFGVICKSDGTGGRVKAHSKLFEIFS